MQHESFAREQPNHTEQLTIDSILAHAERYLYKTPDTLDFHNTEHMHFVYNKTLQYIDYAENNGIAVDGFALQLAAILHDANYFENLGQVNQRLTSLKLITRPFENKEEYSAWTAKCLLESYGIANHTVTTVCGLIMATHVKSSPSTIEEKILVRADLDNVCGDDQIFVLNTLKLVRESDKLDGPKNPIERIRFMFGLLTNYFAKDLCLGEFDEDECTNNFVAPAIANINRLADDKIISTIKALGSRATALLPSLKI